MTVNLYKSKVIKNHKLNDKFHVLTFKIEDPTFVFEPGQFVNLKVNNTTFRSYSIFSHPKTLPYWEMFVDITPGGPGTTYLKNLKKGDVIETTRPVGSFIFQEDKNCDNLFMAATGCGFAPLRPMIEEAFLNPKKCTHFLWGLRKESEVSFINLLEMWTKKYNFNYKIVLSQPGDKWNGVIGHVTDYLPNCNDKKLKKSSMYLAGNGNFVKDAINDLMKNGFPEERIYFEECYFTY